MTDHAMIEVHSLGNVPYEIALIIFDWDTGNTSSQKVWRVDLLSGMILGGQLDIERVGNVEFEKGVWIHEIGRVLEEIKGEFDIHPVSFFWSNGPEKDIWVLDFYFDKLGMTAPWTEEKVLNLDMLERIHNIVGFELNIVDMELRQTALEVCKREVAYLGQMILDMGLKEQQS